jgi:hypothetical protein
MYNRGQGSEKATVACKIRKRRIMRTNDCDNITMVTDEPHSLTLQVANRRLCNIMNQRRIKFEDETHKCSWKNMT